MALIAVGVAIIDWGTKALIVSSIPLGELVVLWEGRIALWHVRNPALVLGLFGDLELTSRKAIVVVLGISSVALLVQVVARSHRLLPPRRRWAWLFSGLLGGGMLGNLGERVLHWGVTDFLSFGWRDLWLPPGNLADVAIILAVPTSILVIVFEFEARARRRASDRAALTVMVPDGVQQ